MWKTQRNPVAESYNFGGRCYVWNGLYQVNAPTLTETLMSALQSAGLSVRTVAGCLWIGAMRDHGPAQ